METLADPAVKKSLLGLIARCSLPPPSHPFQFEGIRREAAVSIVSDAVQTEILRMFAFSLSLSLFLGPPRHFSIQRLDSTRDDWARNGEFKCPPRSPFCLSVWETSRRKRRAPEELFECPRGGKSSLLFFFLVKFFGEFSVFLPTHLLSLNGSNK